MKTQFILFIFLVASVRISGQIYDPYLSSLSILPTSPWGPVNTIGSATFTVGNNGPQAMSHWNECGAGVDGCKLIIQISPNTAYTIIGTDINVGATPTGTLASKFSWFYDSFDGSLRGTQIATINAGESGTITFPIKHIKISTDAVNSPCNGQQNCFGTQVDGNFKGLNGMVINILPPSQPANNNQPEGNDNLGGYQFTYVSLPLQNISFQARPLGNKKVELNWTTLNEINNREFEVERFDAASKSWTMVGKKAAVGFSTVKSEYVYIDQISELKESKIYYRLKSVETNGAFHYTDVRMVTFNSSQALTLTTFPNPFTQSFHLDLNARKEGPFEMRILDVMGRQVYAESNTLREGFSSKLISLDNVPQGTYSVHVTFDGGEHVLKTLKIN